MWSWHAASSFLLPLALETSLASEKRLKWRGHAPELPRLTSSPLGPLPNRPRTRTHRLDPFYSFHLMPRRIYLEVGHNALENDPRFHFAGLANQILCRALARGFHLYLQCEEQWRHSEERGGPFPFPRALPVLSARHWSASAAPLYSARSNCGS